MEATDPTTTVNKKKLKQQITTAHGSGGVTRTETGASGRKGGVDRQGR